MALSLVVQTSNRALLMVLSVSEDALHVGYDIYRR